MLWGVLFAKHVFNMETIAAATLERSLELLLTAAGQPVEPAQRASAARSQARARALTRGVDRA